MSQNSLHIAHVVHRFDTGGLENGVVNLINSLGSEEYTHSIVTLKGHSTDFAARIKTANVKFYDLAKKDGNDLSIFWRMNQLLKQLKPDILHTRNTATLELQLVGWWRRVKLRIHGEHGWDVNDMHGQNLTYRKLRKLLKPFIHQYIALSKEARDYLLDIIKVKPERLNHICNGVDKSKFSPKKDITRTSPFVIGCVGRLEDVKNHVLLAEAFVIASKQTQGKVDIQLQLIGEGSCRDKVESILTANDCIKASWLAGNRNDVAALMTEFDIFVLPSLAEGISNTILEAMACGLPVIATNVGGNAELVQHDHSGYVVNVSDPQEMAERILDYVGQPELKMQHGQNGRALVEQKFSIQVMTSAYNNLYRTGKPAILDPGSNTLP
ncbi:TIGR03088 family PEP-CTERM/XrtA system glycosyltransferase [Paraglaciecola arctica]|uniref:Glycosyl transferase, group 1 n=1 Tax=Paraglaciecola arctica BSs20135 TaxID=493475 RepID=K6XD29_9ALTE|nr:TIGR03088 family PEP-CTERM/XrtA system glycosyltransferase [Paraglaciecola arctica]GAC18539.1 glycosyl transferase, group 1 [Paraglaciecola arctica BSs20135]